METAVAGERGGRSGAPGPLTAGCGGARRRWGAGGAGKRTSDKLILVEPQSLLNLCLVHPATNTGNTTQPGGRFTC